jgi:hypothetical protein
MAITFDTLKFANRLKQAGISAEHAEAEASALADALGGSELVTRQDLQIEIAPLRADMLHMKWMIGVVITGVLSLVVKTFF